MCGMDADNAKTADERASWYVMALYTKKQYNAIAYYATRSPATFALLPSIPHM